MSQSMSGCVTQYERVCRKLGRSYFDCFFLQSALIVAMVTCAPKNVDVKMRVCAIMLMDLVSAVQDGWGHIATKVSPAITRYVWGDTLPPR